jgi:phenylpropionate dioxygenase-like ring-hydroxylating dioxygenase large terminal subunit
MDGFARVATTGARPDRHPGDSYGDILNRDTRPAPAHLHEGRLPDIGVEPVAASRYYDPEFFRKEARHLWSRVWQMACREDDVAEVGDYQIYEILGKSLIVVRQADGTIRAFYNSCLHRARKLVTLPGSKSEFRCPYHGFTWNCDGSFKENPIGWDFPQWEGQDMSLPEAKVAAWGGFVFINFDLQAPPLMEVIAPLAEHFEAYDWPSRFRAVWVQKPVRCNWKALSEAFMESHHSVTTHPQILGSLNDANSQYDLPNDYVSRHFSASAVHSPFIDPMSEQEVLNHLLGQGGRRMEGATAPQLQPGETARSKAAELARANLTAATGRDYAHASDAEMLDALLYNVFPNMSFWAGYPGALCYRWRPNGLDPESAIMDVQIYAHGPKDAPKPKNAPVHELGIDEPWSNAPQLGGLAAIFEQDMGNLPYVQEGLHASGTGLVHFGRYSEMRIRHLHKMVDRYIAEGEARTGG